MTEVALSQDMEKQYDYKDNKLIALCSLQTHFGDQMFILMILFSLMAILSYQRRTS